MIGANRQAIFRGEDRKAFKNMIMAIDLSVIGWNEWEMEVMRDRNDNVVIFFFSSRRRHTRSLRDWSSDVCSSDLLDSTNLEAIRQAKAGAREGLCIIAREQTLGRGRLDRTWQSPPDAGLYFSIVLRPQLEIDAWPLLTLMSALAVSDALMKAGGLRADIKWPNDLCFHDRKVCGILAETVETELGPAAIVGIGINLKADSLPETVRDLATSLESATG